MTAPESRSVDVHALPAMLTALRLPCIQRHWPALAGRADAKGAPVSRLLAALAEIELADRDARRIQRHLREAGLPGGKTLATFDFKAWRATRGPASRRSPLGPGSRPAPT
jgi:DNA replication protein DnaC